MIETWDVGAPGVMLLPSGRTVRGRALRRRLPAGPVPDFTVYLLGRAPEPVPWSYEWLLWRDFRVPADPEAVRETLLRALARSADGRVEVARGGGRGRTGTALACLAVLDGVDPPDAVEYVRQQYDRGAVETPWQRRFVARFRPCPLRPRAPRQKRVLDGGSAAAQLGACGGVAALPADADGDAVLLHCLEQPWRLAVDGKTALRRCGGR